MNIRFALEEVLAEKNMSRYMLAKLTETHYQIIDNYYKNKVSRYDKELLLRMCTVLECVPGDLIRLEDEGTPSAYHDACRLYGSSI